ncbi:hypothetical protein [Agromyces larvae]|uniref:Uncharacterized protein n=1 Tax=Agromyces larvae TaxID=2929802 RepID=A0ABY4C2E9_9MICO|nr:hypothetical protein [Agromyces larvae]UOE45499.1 hypothetical protein MTO99_07005 [Agromyces larvae]
MPSDDLRDRIARVLADQLDVTHVDINRPPWIVTIWGMADAILPLVEEAVREERERCATIADSFKSPYAHPDDLTDVQYGETATAAAIAFAIRTPEPTKEGS